MSINYDDKIIILSDEQIIEIEEACATNEYMGYYEDGCLCGYYEFYIDGVGYITASTSCRKSSECLTGMSWIVKDIIQVWNNSVRTFGYVPPEQDIDEDDDLELLGYLDKFSAQKIKNIVRDSIIRNHSWLNTDEYGNEGVDKSGNDNGIVSEEDNATEKQTLYLNNERNDIMSNEKVTFKIEYTNEFGDITKFEKISNADLVREYHGDIYYLTEMFKSFLSASGFSSTLVDCVQVIDEDF